VAFFLWRLPTVPQVSVYIDETLYAEYKRLKSYINLSRVCQLALKEEVHRIDPTAGNTCPYCGTHTRASA
jgi:hypothetical protein